MASRIVNQGLQRIGDTVSQSSGYSSSRYVRCMSVDDSTVAFAATDTALNTGGAVANEFDAGFDATPTRSSQTVTHVMTIPTGSGNFTIRRVALHDDTTANVTTSSTTLFAGIDGQSLQKTSDFSLELRISLLYSSV